MGERYVKKNLIKHLNDYFGYDSFRMGQREIIEDVLRGEDVLGILPTGSGKSICYQLPALLLEGTTIVVSPLIALMIDQVKQLKAKQIKRVVAINSFMTPQERSKIYRQLNHYQLIYVSPELLQQEDFMFYLKKLSVQLFVIDEAHCISQWGHEFRPDYMKLQHIIQLLKKPTVLALSATATPHVQKDIITSLGLTTMVKHIYPMDRENIVFLVEKLHHRDEKTTYILDVLKRFEVPTLIYFSSRYDAEQMTHTIMHELPDVPVAFYHGGMEQIDRITVQQQFMNDQLRVICCTSAFGMGIDKSNIRLIVHYHLPNQLESYVQEAGRAGRDGKQSISVVLYTAEDEFLPKQLIKNELPTEEEIRYIFYLLYKLYEQKQALPTQSDQLALLFQLNEVQWRFLYAQLEKHGMIKENTIIYEKERWKRAYTKIKQSTTQRLRVKTAKLQQMVTWIHEKQCLRHALYKPFQSNYTEPEQDCCSQCGFSIVDWKVNHFEREKMSAKTWQQALKEMFFIGDEDETK
ncbi:MAG TPA: ATP-dependent DNA helicase RecQ [Cerasibacillus sp.]|uniref:RecQ family ATP-dependent DNA helicase n=1 Tax=Cerasibacillus sp. TaxID=2498711 RepID=UPI002F3F7EEA